MVVAPPNDSFNRTRNQAGLSSSKLIARRLIRALEPPESGIVITRVFHPAAPGRSNRDIHPTAGGAALIRKTAHLLSSMRGG